LKIVKWRLEGLYHYEAHDEPNMTPEKKFEPDILNTLLDTALISIYVKIPVNMLPHCNFGFSGQG